MADKLPQNVGDLGADLHTLAGAAAIDQISNRGIAHLKREP
jgi:hypothetical protein